MSSNLSTSSLELILPVRNPALIRVSHMRSTEYRCLRQWVISDYSNAILAGSRDQLRLDRAADHIVRTE